jgi:hypothetical protein
MSAGIAIAGAVVVAAVVVLLILWVRPRQKRIRGAFGVASPPPKPHASLGAAGPYGNPPHGMPPYDGAGSGSEDAGCLGPGISDEAVMMRTPDVTHEQMPGAAKVRGC